MTFYAFIFEKSLHMWGLNCKFTRSLNDDPEPCLTPLSLPPGSKSRLTPKYATKSVFVVILFREFVSLKSVFLIMSICSVLFCVDRSCNFAHVSSKVEGRLKSQPFFGGAPKVFTTNPLQDCV